MKKCNCWIKYKHKHHVKLRAFRALKLHYCHFVVVLLRIILLHRTWSTEFGRSLLAASLSLQQNYKSLRGAVNSLIVSVRPISRADERSWQNLSNSFKWMQVLREVTEMSHSSLLGLLPVSQLLLSTLQHCNNAKHHFYLFCFTSR